MPLNNIMLNCSGLVIQDAFERIIKKHIPNNAWLGSLNYFKVDTRTRMNKLTIANFSNKRKIQIEEYIASSVIIHSSDGWNYLSRSIESLINGDVASSIHFAYYAELRSVMSLMAFEGIGIFDKQHIWYDVHKNPTLFNNRYTTHSLADLGMEAWSKQATKKEILFDLVKVNNKSLGAWIRETGFSTNTKYANSVINTWLKKWSIDLHLTEDQSIRNEMSYRPHFSVDHLGIEDILNKLVDTWNLLEPTTNNGFPQLDQHLLRIALEEVYKKSTGHAPYGTPYKTYIESIFARIGENTGQPLFNFLLRLSIPDDAFIFQEAKKDATNPAINKSDPFPLICRAILLLRLSTGAANNLVDKSTINKDTLRFWWEKVSFEQGLTNTPASGIDPKDLFADIRDSIEEVLSNVGTLTNINQSFISIPDSLYYLKQFQRPAIWGIVS